jgi:hypothetical protein
MGSFGEPIDRLLLKVKRAEKHIVDLDAEYLRFRQTRPYPYSFDSKTDPITGERVYYVETIKPIPLEFSLLIGDALNNLRSALDHTAHELVRVGKGSVDGTFGHAKFPIFSSASEYRSKSDGAIKGMREDARKAIRGLQPYGGGIGEYYWHLARLNNLDKHRLLLIVWGRIHGHSALPSDRKMLARFYGKSPSEFGDHFMALSSPVFPPKAGDEFLRVPTAEVDEDMKFLVDIAFAEPEIVKGHPVIDTLHAMMQMVRDLIIDFGRFGLFR